MSKLIHQNIFRIYFLGVILLMIQVALGGITRLTGSGLSITSWDLITGFLPPLSEYVWQQEFLNYQKTTQYAVLNTHFTLIDFKFIFFWEWIHRFWARMIGVVVIVCAVYLWRKKYFNKQLFADFAILFLLGALQGVIGWIMVKSGLAGDAIYVAPIKLAIHFLMAVLLIVMTWIYGLKSFIVYHEVSITYSKTLYQFAILIAVLLFIQLIFGCFIAGSRAAATVSTWPSINGSIIPSKLILNAQSIDWIENGVLIQFVHRSIAYILTLIICIWSFYSIKKTIFKKSIAFFNWLPLGLVVLQVILGICSLFYAPYIVPNSWNGFEWVSQLHQIIAIILVLCIASIIYLLHQQKLHKHQSILA